MLVFVNRHQLFGNGVGALVILGAFWFVNRCCCALYWYNFGAHLNPCSIYCYVCKQAFVRLRILSTILAQVLGAFIASDSIFSGCSGMPA